MKELENQRLYATLVENLLLDILQLGESRIGRRPMDRMAVIRNLVSYILDIINLVLGECKGPVKNNLVSSQRASRQEECVQPAETLKK